MPGVGMPTATVATPAPPVTDATSNVVPIPPPPTALDTNGLIRMDKAIAAARRLYPGPVGLLLERELKAWKNEHLRYCQGSLPHEIVDHLLAKLVQP